VNPVKYFNKHFYSIDEFQAMQSFRFKLLRGARLSMLQKNDFLSPQSETKQIMKLVANVIDMKNKEIYRNASTFIHDIPQSVSRYQVTCQPLIYDRIFCSLQHAHQLSIAMRHEVAELQSKEVDFEMFLMRNFLLDIFPLYFQTICKQVLFHDNNNNNNDSMTNVEHNNNYNDVLDMKKRNKKSFNTVDYFSNETMFVHCCCMIYVCTHYIALLFFVCYYAFNIGSRGAGMWLCTLLAALMTDVCFVQTFKVFLKYIVLIRLVVLPRLQHACEALQTRAKLIMLRSNGLLFPSMSLVQKLNPACRIARESPDFPMCRFLVSIIDCDVAALTCRTQELNKKKINNKNSDATTTTTMLLEDFFVVKKVSSLLQVVMIYASLSRFNVFSIVLIQNIFFEVFQALLFLTIVLFFIEIFYSSVVPFIVVSVLLVLFVLYQIAKMPAIATFFHQLKLKLKDMFPTSEEANDFNENFFENDDNNNNNDISYQDVTSVDVFQNDAGLHQIYQADFYSTKSKPTFSMSLKKNTNRVFLDDDDEDEKNNNDTFFNNNNNNNELQTTTYNQHSSLDAGLFIGSSQIQVVNSNNNNNNNNINNKNEKVANNENFFRMNYFNNNNNTNESKYEISNDNNTNNTTTEENVLFIREEKNDDNNDEDSFFYNVLENSNVLDNNNNNNNVDGNINDHKKNVEMYKKKIIARSMLNKKMKMLDRINQYQQNDETQSNNNNKNKIVQNDEQRIKEKQQVEKLIHYAKHKRNMSKKTFRGELSSGKNFGPGFSQQSSKESSTLLSLISEENKSSEKKKKKRNETFDLIEHAETADRKNIADFFLRIEDSLPSIDFLANFEDDDDESSSLNDEKKITKKKHSRVKTGPGSRKIIKNNDYAMKHNNKSNDNNDNFDVDGVHSTVENNNNNGSNNKEEVKFLVIPRSSYPPMFAIDEK